MLTAGGAHVQSGGRYQGLHHYAAAETKSKESAGPIATPCGVLVKLFAVLALVVVASGGGFLFRLAQGWGHVPSFPGSSDLFELGLARLIFAGATGLAILLTLRRVHGIPIAIVFAGLWFCLLFVKWGTVIDPSTGEQIEPGLFDVVLGRQQPQWPAWRAWLREYTNLCLRGLLQTAGPGVLLYMYNYGAQFLLSGAMAGLIFSLGYVIPIYIPAFSAGAELSQFLMGWWWWMVLGTSLLAYRHQYKQLSFILPYPHDSTHRSDRTRRLTTAARIASHIFLFGLTVLWSVCVSFYAQTGPSPSPLLGALVGIASLALLLLLLAIGRVLLWRTAATHDCSEPDARAVLLSCERAGPRSRPWHEGTALLSHADAGTPRSSHEPRTPWRFVLYVVGVLQWLALLALLPLLVYVPYTSAYPGSWHN